MNNQPLVSVIIPTYNRKKYVVKAIDSVLKQTYKNIEIIVIDDGSADGTDEIISEFSKKNPGIISIKNKTNLGFVKTLNKGISSAKGKYIARLDDDDFWRDSQKLEKQVEFFEKNPEYALIGGGVIKIDKEGREIVRFLVPETDENIRKAILISNVFAHSAVIFKKDNWERAGDYDEEFGFFSDWDLWLKLGKFGKFYNFQEFFIYYSDQEQNSGRTTHDYEIRRKLTTNIKLKNKYKNYYPGYKKAILICFANYFYSFLPFRKKLWPTIFWFRKLIFGPSPYKYSELYNKKNENKKI